ncbi:hypothetical protein HN358_05325 [Candidatus Uhrbacteria bacterium]|nr:hypothetical protein [Candidatus Uhrbacteria bacterium]MBT7716818.1 hypothetical protein [Candidatus Uhrbacteria bacterium]
MNKKLSISIIIVVGVIVVIGLFITARSLSQNQYIDDEVYVPQEYQDVELGNDYSGPIKYDDSTLVYGADAPVYVTIYSHNEDSWSSLVNTPEHYEEYRTGLIERAELLAEYGIEWNWQSDQPVIEAMIEYEDDGWLKALPGGLNVLEYLETLGAHFDPHAHSNNYADIAYLIEQLGVKATGIIGGTVLIKCGTEHLGFLNLDSWYDNVGIESDGYVYGSDYPLAKWKPEILSDPGMGGHYYDEWSSGVWRPGDEDKFYINFPDNDIVYIGEGYPHDATVIGAEHASGAEVHSEDGQYIKDLVGKIEDGDVPTGTSDGEKFMYTASIHMRDTDVVSHEDSTVNTVEGIQSVLDELMPLVDSGQIIFVDYETAAEIWETEYSEVPYRYDLFEFKFYKAVRDQAEGQCEEMAPSR